MKQLKVWVGIAVLASAGAAFAGGAETKKEAKRQAAACQDLGKFAASVQAYEQSGPQTSVKEYKQLGDNVSKDFKQFVKSAEKYAKPQVQNVENMIDELKKDARKIPDDATLADARSLLADDLEQVKMASNQLLTKLDCGIGGAGMEQQQQQQQQQGEQQQQQPDQYEEGGMMHPPEEP